MFATLVHHRGGEQHVTEAGRHHELPLFGDPKLLNASELKLDIGRIASRFADDVVLQRAVLGRVVAHIGPGVHILVPNLLETADAGGVARGITQEVVGRIAMRIEAFDAHGGEGPAEVQHPTMAPFTPGQGTVGQALAGLLLDAMPLGLAGGHGLRIVRLHEHALGCGQRLSEREVGPEHDPGVELATVLGEVDALLISVQQFIQAVGMAVVRSIGRCVRQRARGREHQRRQAGLGASQQVRGVWSVLHGSLVRLAVVQDVMPERGIRGGATSGGRPTAGTRVHHRPARPVVPSTVGT